MKAVLHILISEDVGKLLNTREAATRFAKLIRENPCNSVELDFTNVEFMSRSFADQFYKEQLQLQAEFGIIFHILNANEEIINMLSIVAKTQNVKNRVYSAVPVYKFSNRILLSNYLMTI